MTNEEDAIKRIREFGLHHALGDLPYSAHTVAAFEMAIEALEKRIPEKPKMKTTVEKQTKVWFCSCGAMFWGYKEKTPFCPHCGQALDWSEVGE